MIRNICYGIDFPASFQDLSRERTGNPGLKPGAGFLASLRDWIQTKTGDGVRDWNGLSGSLLRIINIM